MSTGFFTRPDLDDRQFKQLSGSTLTLSGETNFGGILKSKGVEIDGATSGASSGWALTWNGTKIVLAPSTGGGGGQEYTGASPTNITVGGLAAGTNISGWTLSEIVQAMVITTYFPTLTNPSVTSFTEDVTNTQEIGTIVPTINFTATFSQGSINPQYPPTASPFRSGLPNNYNYTGAQIAGTYPSTLLSNGQTVTSYKMLLGSNTWTATVTYDGGVQPYDSSGNPYSSPLLGGTTTPPYPRSLTGRYLRFFGASAITPVNSAQVRALPQSEYQTSNVNIFILNTGSVLTKFVVALPPSRTINTAYDLDALNAPMPYAFIGTITVNDGGGTGDPHSYNLYELIIGAPYSSNHRHQITTA